MNEYQNGYDDGLERASLHLQRKADKIRAGVTDGGWGKPTADMMARIFETEAEEILAQRRQST